MRNIKLTIEYDGTNYSGWQIQSKDRSIQSVIKEAIQKITAEKNTLIGSSRTDSGVHAIGQGANFKTNTKIPANNLKKAINSLLPKDISIKECIDVDQDFHAQRSAKAKLYRYVIFNNDTNSPLMNNRAWQVIPKLDIKDMKRAAKYVKGKHDFTAFQSTGSSAKDAIRNIFEVSVISVKKPVFEVMYYEVSSLGLTRGSKLKQLDCPIKSGNDKNIISEKAAFAGMTNFQGDFVIIDIFGDGFVYKMVRNIVGTLVDVGKGRFSVKDFKQILSSKQRKKAGICAPASGLYLIKVFY